MTRKGVGSATAALTRSLLVGLTLIWLIGVVGSGFVLKRLIDVKSDDEMQESGAILMSLIRHTDDLLVTAAVMGETQTPAGSGTPHHRYVFQVRDASGRLLLRSNHAPPQPFDVPLLEGLADASPWRVLTLHDAAGQRWVHFADPLAERRDALYEALLWLMLPLAGVLAFAVFIVYRASRSLTRQVQQTALAVSRQDPQALGMLPLTGVVTEMRPAVEATNRLIARLADALEGERSFTYNSAHELRTPIAAALARRNCWRRAPSIRRSGSRPTRWSGPSRGSRGWRNGCWPSRAPKGRSRSRVIRWTWTGSSAWSSTSSRATRGSPTAASRPRPRPSASGATSTRSASRCATWSRTPSSTAPEPR